MCVGRDGGRAVFVGLLGVLVCATSVGAQVESSARVTLELRYGGALAGAVVDSSPHGLVILSDGKPFVFSWRAIKAESAYRAKRSILLHGKGGLAALSAGDHFELGRFALSRRESEIAADEFRQAERLDAAFRPRIVEAYQAFKKIKRQRAIPSEPISGKANSPATSPSNGLAAPRDQSPANLPENLRGIVELGSGAIADTANVQTSDSGAAPAAIVPVSASMRAKVAEGYQAFARQVQELLETELTLVETEHFLIWTDWESVARPKLAEWAEAMYAALCAEFQLDRADDVFLAKCPMFCFQSRSRLRRFARRIDGYGGDEAIAYTRSVPESGHVHVVLARQGRSRYAYDQFACNLVHEGTHAFLHRLYTSRLIPHWVNEGYAELVADRVLGDRCVGGQDASLLEKQYARRDWSIGDFLASSEPVAVHQYPLAHSVVRHLVSQGDERWRGLIYDLKRGAGLPTALADQYDGMTLEQLEANWKAAAAAGGP